MPPATNTQPQEMQIEDRVPVVCLAPESVSAYTIFNPNDWSGRSRAIVHSCAAFAGVIEQSVKKIGQLCSAGRQVCLPRFKDLAASIRTQTDVPNRVRPLAQVPELHSAIVVFLVSVKIVLDFLTQLVCAQGVVNATLDGFHRDANEYGGRLLKCLERNSVKDRKETAEALAKLIRSHKGMWINGVIRARDELTHPEKGFQQLMFEMQISASANGPVLNAVTPPRVAGQTIDEYARQVEQHFHEFARSMLGHLAKPGP